MNICDCYEYQDVCERAGEYIFCPIDLELIIKENQKED